MPVIPVFAYIGTALGASASTAAATGAVVTASVAASATGAVLSAEASNRQAAAASQAANYNANVDIANAKQLEMNTNANIANQRASDAEYKSRQRAAYAASGVLSGTGSALSVQATTAGKMEQDIQQYWANTQEQESAEYGAAEEGVFEGGEEANAYHLEGAASIMQGIGSIAGTGIKVAQGANQ